MKKFLLRTLSIIVLLIGLIVFLFSLSISFDSEINKEHYNKEFNYYTKTEATIDSVIEIYHSPRLSLRKSVRDKDERDKYLHYEYVISYKGQYDVPMSDTITIWRNENKSEADYQVGQHIAIYYNHEMNLKTISEDEYIARSPSEEKTKTISYICYFISILFFAASIVLWKKGGKKKEIEEVVVL